MTLQSELGLRHGFQSPAHEALLNIHYSAAMLKKKADIFLRQFDLTDVQLNLMFLLLYQAGESGGLTQVELSRMMQVNRANITSLIDRMERDGLVKRAPVEGDRRANLIQLTTKGKRLSRKVESVYFDEVERIMAPLRKADLAALIDALGVVRESLRES